jgi:hypothetical protein
MSHWVEEMAAVNGTIWDNGGTEWDFGATTWDFIWLLEDTLPE